MSDKAETKGINNGHDARAQAFSRAIGAKAARKIRAQNNLQGVWFGLGMTGLIGWSIVIPTLLGIACGIWLDSRNPGIHSWTLMMLAAGLGIGALNAWHWVALEEKAIEDNESG